MYRRTITILLATFAAALLLAPASPAIPPDCDLDCPVENLPPTVELTASPTSAPRGATIKLTADAQDGDGDSLTSDWDLDNDGSYDDAADVFEVSVSFSTVGAKTVKVRVSDGAKSVGDTATVTIVNRTPTASFSRNPFSPLTLENVTFTSTSSDPDGDALTYSWDLNGDSVYGDATGPFASRSFPAAGSYPIGLRVTDSLGDAHTTTISIPILNRTPLAAFTFGPATPKVGDVVTFDSASASDEDGTIASRAWDLDDDGQYDDGTGITASRAFPAAGTYDVRLQVTDNDGAANESGETVTVAPQDSTDPVPGGGEGGGADGGSKTPVTDSTAPSWSAKLAPKQRALKRKAIALRIKPSEACVLAVTAKLGKKRLGSLMAALPANVLTKQRVKLTKKGRAAVRKALRKKKLVTVNVALTCTDATGNAAAKTYKVKVKR